MSEKDAVVVYCTVPDAAVGKEIAETIVHERLCACVNQVPAVTSYYIYNDEFNVESEEFLMIKTRMSHFEVLKNRIIELHPYDVPEIIAAEIIAGSQSYLQWLGKSLKSL